MNAKSVEKYGVEVDGRRFFVSSYNLDTSVNPILSQSRTGAMMREADPVEAGAAALPRSRFQFIFVDGAFGGGGGNCGEWPS